MPMKFWKYHALGNDYLVLDPKDFPSPLSTAQVKAICHRNFGVGADGILLGPLPSRNARFGLRIFNPDGSEAEKSGNGLRIFSRYLWDRKLARDETFEVETPGGVVKCTVLNGGGQVRVEMGRVSFWSDVIPVTGPRREVINEQLQVGGREFRYCAATIGNPHCVVLLETTPELAREFGPLIEVHPNFPNRTNVQFLRVLDRKNLEIRIWERGAGYTLASGSSSSAAAAVAYKLGLCDPSVSVHMPGGQLAIEIGPDFGVLLTGPVTKVAEGTLAPDLLDGSVPV
jgi:diaminopimelate epimerase